MGCLLEAFYTHLVPAAPHPSGRAARHPLTWHFAQLPLVSKATPAGWWQAPQEVLAVSAVLCITAFQFNGALASCGQFAGWQVLHSSLARLACAVWSYVTLPFLALNTSLVGGFLSWATMDVNATMAKSRKPAKTFRMTVIIRGRRPKCHGHPSACNAFFMRPPLVPVPRLPVECNLGGHSRRRSLSCSPRRYSTGCSNCCPLPQGICRLDGRISSRLSCLSSEQFLVQPANLYAPWIGLPGCHEAPPGGMLPRFPGMHSCSCVAASAKLRNETLWLRPHCCAGGRGPACRAAHPTHPTLHHQSRPHCADRERRADRRPTEARRPAFQCGQRHCGGHQRSQSRRRRPRDAGRRTPVAGRRSGWRRQARRTRLPDRSRQWPDAHRHHRLWRSGGHTALARQVSRAHRHEILHTLRGPVMGIRGHRLAHLLRQAQRHRYLRQTPPRSLPDRKSTRLN